MAGMQLQDTPLTHWDLARRLFGSPVRGGRNLDRCVEVRVCGLDVEEVAPNIFLRRGDDALDVSDRIVGSGPGKPRP